MERSESMSVWRSGKKLGAAVREARERIGLTQAQLAQRAAVGLKFLYELESGKDTVRVDKVLSVLDALGLYLAILPRNGMLEVRQPHARYGAAKGSTTPVQADYIGMACTTAGVSLRRTLAPDELVRALLTGKPTAGKQAHFIVLLEEAPTELLLGLVAQVGAWATPAKVARNIRKIAADLGVHVKITDRLGSA